MAAVDESAEFDWIEIIKLLLLIPYGLLCFYVFPNLPIVTLLDRLVLIVTWSAAYFLLLVYLAYLLDCRKWKPDERPGLFRYSAQGSRNVLPFFCFFMIATAFVSPISVIARPVDENINVAVKNGDQIWWTPVSYITASPARGDIVKFYVSDSGFIRRIVGLPGETIEVKDGSVIINNRLLDEPYRFTSSVKSGASKLHVQKVLAPDEYLIISDDRSSIVEKEMFARQKDIIGKAFFRFLPFRRMGLLPEVKYNF